MRIGLLAEKIGMTRFFDKDKINHSVTILKIRDCKVVSVNNIQKNGYNSITLSHGITEKKIGKPFKGFLKKNNLKAFSNSQEFRVSNTDSFKVGDKLGVNNFIVGQFVDVSSNSIGKGFAGGMKRHNFAGNRATHGVSISHRSHGSTGQCQDPGKVFKGKKMAGRLGNKKVTIQNLKILELDVENDLMIIKGAVPGHRGSVISVVDSVKKKQDIIISQSLESSQMQNAPDDVNNKGKSITDEGDKTASEEKKLISTEPETADEKSKSTKVKMNENSEQPENIEESQPEITEVKSKENLEDKE